MLQTNNKLKKIKGDASFRSFYRKSLSITDRKEAIRTAVALAKPGDIILLAGKGHEKYQEIDGVKYPFDDKEILNETFQSY